MWSARCFAPGTPLGVQREYMGRRSMSGRTAGWSPNGRKGVLCRECAALRLGVPGMCQGYAGLRLGKRCKWLIYKPMYSRYAAENPRVGGSIPPLATNSKNPNLLRWGFFTPEIAEGRGVARRYAKSVRTPASPFFRL